MMKRLALLTILLLPAAVPTVHRFVANARHGVPVGPRGIHRLSQSPERIRLLSTETPEAPRTTLEVRGYPKVSPTDATAEARHAAVEVISKRLQAMGVPSTWSPPAPLVDEMITEGSLQRFDKDYGTVYVRTLVVDLAEPRLASLLEARERQIAGQRLVKLGGLITFVLVCLGTLASYIRADEATKGYYTRTLQGASLVAVGASGAALAYWLA